MARLTMRQAITDALREEMHRDERVFIMGEEVGVWGGTYAVTRGFLTNLARNGCAIRLFPRWSLAARPLGGHGRPAPVAEFMTINFAFVRL
jgi:pyruvate dehydrogenase E1 component beta subunit